MNIILTVIVCTIVLIVHSLLMLEIKAFSWTKREDVGITHTYCISVPESVSVFSLVNCCARGARLTAYINVCCFLTCPKRKGKLS